jgi:hypothetical protein
MHALKLTKCAQIPPRFLDPNPKALMDESDTWQNKKYQKLNNALAQIIEDFSMVQFLPLDNTDEESIGNVLMQIDNAIQYGEDLEVKEKDGADNDSDVEWNENGD